MNTESRDWIRLDNAAKIYPAAKRRNWTALFRMAATLTEEVDVDVLEVAQRIAMRRVENFSYVLKRGMFWYYMERADGAPRITPDGPSPCVPFHPEQNGGFCFRVRYYKNRIAIEVFHALTDGTGGMVFLKTLVAEYLRLRYGAVIPRGNGILDCTEAPRAAELEDGFLKYARSVGASRREAKAFHIRGIPELPDTVHVTDACMPAAEVLARAKALGVSLTEYLTAVMILAVDGMQRARVPLPRLYRQVKINVPVNLRQLFPSETLRNFSSYVNPGIDPRLGEYTLDEVAHLVHHYMRQEITEKGMNARFSANVHSERNALLRVVPLFLKNIVMRSVFVAVGDKKTSTCLSNIGRIELPEQMARYVTGMDLILGPLSFNRVACAAHSYQRTLTITITSTLRDASFERAFCTRLVQLGIPVRVESNRRGN